jgi:uncharacterized protein
MIDRTQKEFFVVGGTGPGEVNNVRVEFVAEGAGAFGRDKKTSVDEANRANVSYVKDHKQVEAVLDVPAALALLAQAERDTAAAVARHQQATDTQQAELEEAKRRVANLTCLVCEGSSFETQTSREDSQWGMSSFRMKLLICRRCGYVMQFYLGASMFVPGS